MVSYCGHLYEDLHTSHGPIMIALFRCQMCSPQLKCDLGIEVKCTISTHASKSRPIFYGPETPPPLPPSTHARLQHPPPPPLTLRIVPGPGCCPPARTPYFLCRRMQTREQQSRRYGRMGQIGLLDPASHPFASLQFHSGSVKTSGGAKGKEREETA